MGVLLDRLRAFLTLARRRQLAAGVDLDRLSRLRRLHDVRVRAFAVGKERVSGLELCELLADPKSGRFDAAIPGLLRTADLEAGFEALGEDMGVLVEACLLFQVYPRDAWDALVKEAVASLAPLADAPSARPSGPVSPAARPLAAAKELWTAPAGPLRAAKLLDDPDPKPDRVAAEIDKEPGFSARFLRLAAALGRPETSVLRAVVALGAPLSKQALGAATLALKLGVDPAFWSHALRAAFAASLASRRAKVGNPDAHWFAALLHEAGAPLKARYAPAADVPTAEVGAFVLERWKFPPAVVAAARHHGAPLDVLEEASLPREALVAAAACRLVRGEDVASLLRLDAPGARTIEEEAARLADVALPDFLPLGAP